MGDDGRFYFRNKNTGEVRCFDEWFWFNDKETMITEREPGGTERTIPSTPDDWEIEDNLWNKFCMRCAHRQDFYCTSELGTMGI